MCSPLWRGRLDGHGAPPVPREGGAVVADYDPAIAEALTRIVTDPDPWGKWHAFADAPGAGAARHGDRSAAADVAEAMAGHDRAVLARWPMWATRR
jgi:hypothetical protein